MTISNLITAENEVVENYLIKILDRVHSDGPILQKDFESLSYIKKFRIELFSKYEKKLIYLIGLFYKTSEPESILEEVYKIYSDSIFEESGIRFTPIQADAYKSINEKVYFSFSAPTSAGKSFLFKELIKDAKGDIIIVVPSRALIAEYIAVVSEILKDDKSILILQFIENINKAKTKRRIYIITPERGIDLFKNIHELNIELFLFDEAQISDEQIRGLTFDSFVRRVDKLLPNAKKVFTHPFIQNPEAQLEKHNFSVNSSSKRYDQNAVGKIYLSNNKTQFNYFSPFNIEEKREKILADENIAKQILKNEGTILIYISKNKIYTNKYLEDFNELIKECPKLEDYEAIKMIAELRDYIGALQYVKSKHSLLIDLMEKGIVIHHGSIPLKARLMIENFVNRRFARICFSTATLIQGINMPFDLVWIDNFRFEGSEEQKNLNLKNLIGRAGRSTLIKNAFDYGYVVIKDSNVKTFCDRMKNKASLKNTSLLDENVDHLPEDLKDLVEAIRENSFNDQLHITNEQVERLVKADIDNDLLLILDNLLINNRPLKANEYYQIKDSKRNKIKDAFKIIFISHLRRNELTKAEQTILSTSIPILLWQIQGKSFKEIISLRYAYLSQQDKKREINVKLKKKEITGLEAKKLRKGLDVRRSIIATQIPNKNAKNGTLYKMGTPVSKIQYDLLVFDTYDFIDKVISLSLKDPLSAAFQIFYDKTKDSRALIMKNLIKYGTNDVVEIWLLRYGFSFEDIEWVRKYVLFIDENKIDFNPFIPELNERNHNIINRYI
jgi:superfamily II DNA/RNA helicase